MEGGELHFCPHCGFNLSADKPIEIGRWRLTPSYAELDGQVVNLTSSEAGVLYAVAAGRGRAVRKQAIFERVSIDAADGSNVVDVYLCRLRKKLGSSFPVGKLRGRGLVWQEAA